MWQSEETEEMTMDYLRGKAQDTMRGGMWVEAVHTRVCSSVLAKTGKRIRGFRGHAGASRSAHVILSGDLAGRDACVVFRARGHQQQNRWRQGVQRMHGRGVSVTARPTRSTHPASTCAFDRKWSLDPCDERGRKDKTGTQKDEREKARL